MKIKHGILVELLRIMLVFKNENSNEISFEQGGGIVVWLISLTMFAGLAAHLYSIDSLGEFEWVFLLSLFFIFAVFKRTILSIDLDKKRLFTCAMWFGIPYRKYHISLSQIRSITLGGGIEFRYLEYLSEAERKAYNTVKIEYSGGERVFRLVSVNDVIKLFEFVHKKTTIPQFFEKGVGGAVESLDEIFNSNEIELHETSKAKLIEQQNRLKIISVPFLSLIGVILSVCICVFYVGALLLIYVISNESLISETTMLSVFLCTVATFWLVSYAYLKASLTVNSEDLFVSVRGWFRKKIPLEQVKGCLLLGSDLALISENSTIRIGKRISVNEAQYVQNWLNKAKSRKLH